MRATILVSLFALIGAGCGAGRTSGICAELKPTGQGDSVALAKEGTAAWAKRLEKAQVEKSIKEWTQSLAIKPNQPHVRLSLARAHYFYADGFLRFEEEKTKEMLGHFKKATNNAELALGQFAPKYKKKHCGRWSYKVSLATLNKEAVPMMYWYAASLGKYALAKSIVLVLNEKDRIKAMMDKIYAWDRTYYHNASARYLGAYFTKIPFPGGDLPESAKKFRESMEGSPNYLATRVLYAELNVLKMKDRKAAKALFAKLLKEVLAFDLSKEPALIPENTIEQKKAKRLLDEIDVYFPED